MSWLQLKGVTRRFGKAEVLCGIDLSLGADEMLVVLGPTGCGKTITLRAHFIGSPSMNFITGEIREDCFVAPGLVWPLAERVRSGSATLGVRPEFVRPDAKGRLRAEVVRDEYQGACRYIHLQAECGRLVMQVADRDREAVGASLGLDFARVLLFDPASGKRL